jgi:hypothetical protein
MTSWPILRDPVLSFGTEEGSFLHILHRGECSFLRLISHSRSQTEVFLHHTPEEWNLGKQEQPAETGSKKGLGKKWNELVPANTIRDKCVNEVLKFFA